MAESRGAQGETPGYGASVMPLQHKVQLLVTHQVVVGQGLKTSQRLDNMRAS